MADFDKTYSHHKYEVYIYDTQIVQSEYDDPLLAVVFRYPSYLSDDHVVCTAGQLAGMARFFTDTLGENPTFFQLNRGRFEIERMGRYLLFVGDLTVESILPDNSALNLQRAILGPIQFFFGDLEAWRKSLHFRRGKPRLSKLKQSQAISEKFAEEVEAILGLIFRRYLDPPCQSLPMLESELCLQINRSCQRAINGGSFEGCQIQSNLTPKPRKFSSFQEPISHFVNLLPGNESLFEGVQYQPSFPLPLGVKIYVCGRSCRNCDENDLHSTDTKSLELNNSKETDDTSSCSSNSNLTDYEYDLEAIPDVKSPRRRSRSHRSESLAKIRYQKEKERTHFLDTMRKIVQLTRVSRSDVIALNEQFIIFVQTLGWVELWVGFRSRTVNEGVVRALWDVGLCGLPRLGS